uniref:Uncharacterized protein n=1 Tax=viral metagenome TaxID=1070528 RepID=A0A6C0H102_9ZZZZ
MIFRYDIKKLFIEYKKVIRLLTLYKMTTPKRIFRISKGDLQILINYHTIRDTQTGNSIITFYGNT